MQSLWHGFNYNVLDYYFKKNHVVNYLLKVRASFLQASFLKLWVEAVPAFMTGRGFATMTLFVPNSSHSMP